MPFKDKAKIKEYRRARRERDTQLQREWRSRNPDYHKEYRRMKPQKQREANLRMLYGIGIADYNRMFEAQGGACAICKKQSDKNLDVDHDHKTGEVRGLLCNSCNRAIGYLKDDPELCRAAAEYLSKK